MQLVSILRIPRASCQPEGPMQYAYEYPMQNAESRSGGFMQFEYGHRCWGMQVEYSYILLACPRSQ